MIGLRGDGGVAPPVGVDQRHHLPEVLRIAEVDVPLVAGAARAAGGEAAFVRRRAGFHLRLARTHRLAGRRRRHLGRRRRLALGRLGRRRLGDRLDHRRRLRGGRRRARRLRQFGLGLDLLHGAGRQRRHAAGVGARRAGIEADLHDRLLRPVRAEQPRPDHDARRSRCCARPPTRIIILRRPSGSRARAAMVLETRSEVIAMAGAQRRSVSRPRHEADLLDAAVLQAIHHVHDVLHGHLAVAAQEHLLVFALLDALADPFGQHVEADALVADLHEAIACRRSPAR